MTTSRERSTLTWERRRWKLAIRKLFVLGLLACLCSAAATPVLAAPDSTTSPPATSARDLTVSGRVVDSFGQPVAGAVVELLPVVGAYRQAELLLADRLEPDPEASTETGSDGRYHLTAPTVGLWNVRVAAVGKLALSSRLHPLTTATVLPDAILPTAGRVTLEVRAKPGASTEQAAELLSDARAWMPSKPLPATVGPVAVDSLGWVLASRLAVADGRGRIELPVASGEDPGFEVWTPGYLPRIFLQPLQQVDSVALVPLRSAPVRIRDGADRPVAAVVARIGYAGWPSAWSDDDGRCTLGWLPPGALPAMSETSIGRDAFDLLSAEGLQGSALVTELAPELAHQIDGAASTEPSLQTWVLQEGTVLSGRVLDARDQRPVAGAVVWLGAQSSATTSADGSFRLLVAEPAHAAMQQQAHVLAAAAGYLATVRPLGNRTDVASTEIVLHLAPAVEVVGEVVTVAGEPVAGVWVLAEPDGASLASLGRAGEPGIALPSVRSVWSDGQGRFRLADLMPELEYRLRVAGAGAHAQQALQVAALDEQQPSPRLVLEPGCRVVGEVAAADGRPLAGAVVALYPVEVNRPRPPVADFEVFTEPSGRFEVPAVAAGAYDLLVVASGHVGVRIPGLEIEPGARERDLGQLFLDPGHLFEAQVVDGEGQPVSGAEVIVKLSGLYNVPDPVRRRLLLETGKERLTTGTDGFFRVPDVAPGQRVDLFVFKDGYLSATVRELQVPPAELFDVTLQQGGWLSGRVTDAEGKPIAGARVQVEEVAETGGMNPEHDSAMTSPDGLFRMSTLKPGRYGLRVVAEGFIPTELPEVTVRAGQRVDDLALVLEQGAEIVGLVLGPDAVPVAGAEVSLVTDAPDEVRWARGVPVARTDSQGAFRLRGVSPGRHRVEARHEEHAPVRAQVEVPASGVRVTLIFEGGHVLSGWILDSEGLPVAGAELYLYQSRSTPTSSGPSRPGSDRRQAVSQADGAFEFTALRDGEYQLQVRKEGYADPPQQQVRIDGASTRDLEVRLYAGLFVVGTVSGPSVDQLLGGEVYAHPRRGGSVVSGMLDHQRHYRVGPLTPGVWTIRAVVGGRTVSGQVEVVDGVVETRLDLEIPPGIQVQGQVVRAGQPVSQARVEVRSDAENAGTLSDPQGFFQLEIATADSYTLFVAAPESRFSGQRQLDPGDLGNILFELSAARLAGWVLDATGSPRAGVEIRLFPKLGGGGDVRTTDEAGRFAFSEVPDGVWLLLPQIPGRQRTEVEVELVNGQDLEDLELVF